MEKLHIEVKYSASYRPQANGLLERQHRCLKDSLKAALIDMGDKFHDKWLDHLPFVLLGRRVAYQADIGASASELTFGKNVVIPGQVLQDPGEVEDQDSLQALLSNIRNKTDRPAAQTSNHSKQEKLLQAIPENVECVYVRQHHRTGLQAPFEGPFKVAERLSRSTFKLEVGQFKDGTKRYEVRHANDLKIPHPDSLAKPISRPALGRPAASKVADTLTVEAKLTGNRFDNFGGGSEADMAAEVNKPVEASSEPVQPASHATSKPADRESVPLPTYGEGMGKQTGPPPKLAFSRPQRSTRNPNPIYVDSISSRPWSASSDDIKELNRAINKRSAA